MLKLEQIKPSSEVLKLYLKILADFLEDRQGMKAKRHSQVKGKT